MLSKFSVKKPLIVVVLVIILIALGVVSYMNTEVDLLPAMDLPYIVVATVYPGAAPDLVESDLTIPVENALSSISGIKEMTSMSNEHFSMVILELTSDADGAAVQAEIDRAMKTVKLPDNDLGIEPIVLKIDPSLLPIMMVSVGVENMTSKDSVAYLNDIMSKLASVDGVASIGSSGLVTNMALIMMNDVHMADTVLKQVLSEFGAEITVPVEIKEAIREQLNDVFVAAESDPSYVDPETGLIDPGKVLDGFIDVFEDYIDQAEISDPDNSDIYTALRFVLGFVKENSAVPIVRESAVDFIQSIVDSRFILEDNDNKYIFYDMLDDYFNDAIALAASGVVSSLSSTISIDLLSMLLYAQDISVPAGSVSQGAKSVIVKVGDTVTNRGEFINLPIISLDLGEILAEYLSTFENILTMAALAAPNEDGSIDFTDLHLRAAADFIAEFTKIDQIEDFGSWAVDTIASAVPGTSLYMQSSARTLWATTINDKAEFKTLTQNWKTNLPDDWRTQVLKCIKDNAIYLPSDTPIVDDPEVKWGEKQAEFEAQITTLTTGFAAYESWISDVIASIGQDAFDQIMSVFDGMSSDQAFSMMTGIINLLAAYGGEGAVTITPATIPNPIPGLPPIELGYNKYNVNFRVMRDTIRDFTTDKKVRLTLSNLGEIVFLDDSSKQITTLLTKDENGNFVRSTSVQLSIDKESGKSSAVVSEGIKAMLEKLAKDDPNFKYTILTDDGESIGFMMNTVISNLLYGALLAIVVLIIFLRSIKATFAVAMSIVISVVFTFVLMYFSGITLNIVSMGGLALGVGMLVDNSIVVLENIYRMKAQGKNNYQAAIQGAKQVSMAIIASTLTTMVVFVPIIFISGIVQEIFKDLALTICYSLLASLLAALMIVPMSFTTFLKDSAKPETKIGTKIKKGYAKALNFSLNNKWFVIILVVALLGGSIGAFLSLGTEFFPDSYMGSMSVSVKIDTEAINAYNERNQYDVFDDEYYTVDQANRDALEDMVTVLSAFPDVQSAGMYTDSGLTIAGMSLGGSGLSASIKLVEQKDRQDDPHTVVEKLQAEFDRATKEKMYTMNVSMVTMASMVATSTGGSYDVYVFGDEYDEMTKEAAKLAQMFKDNIDGVTDVTGLSATAKEYKLIVDKEKASEYGLTVGQIYLQLMAELTDPSSLHTLHIYPSESDTRKEGVEVFLYSPSTHQVAYQQKSWYNASFADGRDGRVYFANNESDTEAGKADYWVLNETDKTMFIKTGTEEAPKFVTVLPGGRIPLEKNDNVYSYKYANPVKEGDEHVVSYETVTLTVTDPVKQYSIVREDVDLLVLNINSEDSLGTGAEIVSVPLWQLLDDESFARDSSGNIKYRKDMLGNVTEIPEGVQLVDGYSSITRVQRQKQITLSVKYDSDIKEKDMIKLLNGVIDEYNLAKPASVRATTDGGQTIMDEVFNTLYLVLIFAIALIYLVMVAQFQSWKSPFIIMFTVPLAFTGSFLLLAMAGMKLSVMSLMGLIILMGVVVNNGIVFVDYANRLIEDGVPMRTAMFRTGLDRMRPIFMTALTTVLAMIIMATDSSDYGQLLQPLAVTSIGGLLYATVVTLFIIPIMYELFNKKKKPGERLKAFKDAEIDKVDMDDIFDELNPETAAYIDQVQKGNKYRIIRLKGDGANLDSEIWQEGRLFATAPPWEKKNVSAGSENTAVDTQPAEEADIKAEAPAVDFGEDTLVSDAPEVADDSKPEPLDE